TALRTVDGEVEAPDDALAVQQRHHEVPPALAPGHVDLELEVEAPEGQRPVAIADEVVEGRQQHRPRLGRSGRGLVQQLEVVRVDKPVAFEPELHRNGLSRSFEILPDARQPLVTVPHEVPLHLKRRGHAERAEGADRGLAKRGRAIWNRSDRRSKPGIRESPTPPAPEPTRWDDPALEPEEREGIRNRTPGAPAGFVLLRVLFEVRGADRTIGRKPLEDERAEPSSRRQPGRGRASVGPGRRQREVQRAVLGGNDRRLMSPVLVEAPLVPEQSIDQRWIVRTETAEDHEEMAASDDGGRVKLQ